MRPASADVCRFINEYRDRFGVVPICRALRAHGVQIAPRTFYTWRRRCPARRALWEITVTEILAGFYEPDRCGRRRPESLYGAVKMWAHLRRQGIPVARCTIERVMRAHGWRGVRRGARIRTTIAGRHSAADLVDRQFRVPGPNRLFVADFTHVPIGRGCGYTAFVIDAYAGAILGWQVATRPDAAMVCRALADALETRHRQGHPVPGGTVHHSDAGAQYTSVAFGQHLRQAGIQPSIGSIGDALDNALAETTIGLYKTECTQPGSPFHTGLRTATDLEAATAAWVHWYNTSRLMHRLGRRPPAEAEADHYADHNAGQPVALK